MTGRAIRSPSGYRLFFSVVVGNLISVTDALGNITEYSYDEAGNRLIHTDPNGNTETWTYDDLGQVVSHTLPLSMTESYTYDPMGNVLTHTDFNGDTITYAYSPCCGRLIEKSFPDGGTISYTYFGDGKRETLTDARGLTSYVYDDRGRLESVTDPDGSIISYTYDAKGNRTSVTVPSGTTNYTYDALNRPATVTDPAGGVTSYAYDANGNREQEVSPNGTIAEYTYDALNRLIYLENRKSEANGGAIISSYFYTLDPAGNRRSVSEPTGRQVNYTYDVIFRLVAEEIIDPANGSQTISYAYDGTGNRLTKTDGTGTITYAYDQNDRLITEAGPGFTHIYTYDANGNTIGKTGPEDAVVYTYDYENRLIGMDTNTSTAAYIYDADGIRVRQIIDGITTDFIVDKNRDYAQVLEEKDNLGSLTVSYVHGDDLVNQDRSGAKSYYHVDGLGSTRALTDAAESVTDTYDYEAFGELIHSTGSTQNSYLYTGEQYDPNAGFYYLRARYYDQATGRFVTADPFEGKLNEPTTLHKYMYAGMNPVMYVDPTGKFGISEMMVTIGITSVLNSIQKTLPTVEMEVKLCRRDLDWYYMDYLRKIKKEAYHSFVLINNVAYGLTTNEPEYWNKTTDCWIEGPGYITKGFYLDHAAAIEGYWGGSCEKIDCKKPLLLLSAIENDRTHPPYYCLNPDGTIGLNCQEWANLFINSYCR